MSKKKTAATETSTPTPAKAEKTTKSPKAKAATDLAPPSAPVEGAAAKKPKSAAKAPKGTTAAAKPTVPVAAAAAPEPGKKSKSSGNGAGKPGTGPVLSINQEEVAKLAYSYAEARGFQGGSAEEDWLRAEMELRRLRGLA